MAVDETFEHDLRRWVHGVYVRRELLRQERSHTAVEALFDRERHVLTWLAAQLMVTIALLPWWGAWGVLGGLAVLYVGTLVSGAWTLRKEDRLTKAQPRDRIALEAERAFAQRPPLDADARALLTRIMNLAGLRPTARSEELLRRELRETLAMPPLAAWPFLHELADVLESPDARRFGGLTPSRADRRGW